MAVSASQVSVGTSATSILDVGDSGAVAEITNQGANPVFIGGSGVTTSTGYSLAAGATLRLTMSPEDEVFGIVASGSETVHVISA